MFFPHPRVFLTAIKIGPRFLEEFREAIFGYREEKVLFFSRTISAFIGGLTIPLLYLVTKKLFNKTTALFAVFFLAFNYRHVLGSHFGLPDVHNSFFGLLALGASILLLEKNTRNRYLFAGITVGISLSIKYQIFSFLPFLLVHLIWTTRKRNWRYLFHKNFILASILIPIVFLILNPYLLFNLKTLIYENRKDAGRYAMGTNRLFFYPYYYLYHWGIGRLPSLAIILGMILMLILKSQLFFLVFSFVFPFFFVMTYYSAGGGMPRNFVSVVPFLFIFAGFFFYVLSQLVKKIKLIPTSLIVIPLLLYFNFIPIKNSFITSIYYAQPWNYTKISDWIIKKMPSKVKVNTYNITIYPQADKTLKKRGVEWLSATYVQGPNSLAEFREEGTDFVIANSESIQSATYWWRLWPYKSLSKYNDIPFEFIQSSFVGLTVKELQNYTVYEAYKPWQAYEYNYLIFKIPPKPKELGNKIAAFNFDNKNQMWQLRSTFDFEPFKFEWTKNEGKTNPGALMVFSGGGTNTSRLGSFPIPVTSEKLYTIRGWIKNIPEEKNENYNNIRDGFLRIDFYHSITEQLFDQLGTKVALSPRVPISNQWTQVQASLIAPSQASCLTVSFQVEGSSRRYSSFLDDVEIFETETVPKEKFPEVPYIKSTIPLEDTYLNSFL
jgi:MFS family permease